MIKISMIFGLQRGRPWVYFRARSPTGKDTSFVAPLAELDAYIRNAFLVMETLG